MAYYKIAVLPGRGRGLVATQRIPVNTILMQTPVVVVPAKDIRGSLEHYVFHFGDNLTAVALGDASLINYASPANCDYAPDYRHKTIVVTSNRVISTGEELTIDYGWDAKITKNFVKIGGAKYKSKSSGLLQRLEASVAELAEEKEVSPHHEIFVDEGLEHTHTTRPEGRTMYYYKTKSGRHPDIQGDIRTDLQSVGYKMHHNYYGEPEKDKKSTVLTHGNSKVDIRHDNTGSIYHVIHTIRHMHRASEGASMTKTSKTTATISGVLAHDHYTMLGKFAARLSQHKAKELANYLEAENPQFKKDYFLKFVTQQRAAIETAAAKRHQLRHLKGADDHKNVYGFYRRYISPEDMALFPAFQRDLDDLVSEYKGDGLEAVQNRSPDMPRHDMPAEITQPAELAPAIAMARTIGGVLARR
jgi:hypothetical protein